jgi:hypothetical protein
MDYLVIEGYKSAAEEFSQEANLTTPVDFESIETRMDIREALQRGDVEDAIIRVNDLNPDVSPSCRTRREPSKRLNISCTTLKRFCAGDDTKPKTSVFNMILLSPRLVAMTKELTFLFW